MAGRWDEAVDYYMAARRTAQEIGDGVYAATKHAAVGFAEWMAITYGDRGIRVSCICPGAVDTPMTGGVWDNDESRARMKRDVPLGVVAQPGNIASVAGFLLSPAAHHLTGQIMAVDGGSTAA